MDESRRRVDEMLAAANPAPDPASEKEPEPELVTGPFTDAERIKVDALVHDGLDTPEIAARLNRQAGPVATLVRHTRARLAKAKPEPVTPPIESVAPIAKVPSVDPDVPPFAGDLSSEERIAQEWDARVAAVPLNRLFDRAMDLDLMSCLSAGMAAKDFALTRELTPAEVFARFGALMGDTKRTIENQGHCVAALKRAVGSA